MVVWIFSNNFTSVTSDFLDPFGNFILIGDFIRFFTISQVKGNKKNFFYLRYEVSYGYYFEKFI